MQKLRLEINNREHSCDSSLTYKNNRIELEFNVDYSRCEFSEYIGNLYMKGDTLKGVSMQLNNDVVAIMDKSSVDSSKSDSRVYKLQLNQVELVYKNKKLNEGIIINLPPKFIAGLTKESKQKVIEALDCKIMFCYRDETTTWVVCPKDLQKFIVSLISLYYCFPIEILQEYEFDEENNQTKFTLKSQKRSFEEISSRLNLYSNANNVVEFLQSTNTNHSHYMDLPRYARQYIDSYSVSEPQRYNMLFAMASSYAEYILKEGRNDGQSLVEKTIEDLEITGLSIITKTIKEGGLKKDRKDIDSLAGLRNESEHSLYSDKSYEFFDKYPSVNVFMDDIASRIVMKLAGINIVDK